MDGSTREPDPKVESDAVPDWPADHDDAGTGDDVDEALAAASRVADELDAETEPLFDEDGETVGHDAGPAQAAASAELSEPLPPVEAAAAEQTTEADEAEDEAEPGAISQRPAPVDEVPPPTQPSRRALAKSAAVLIGAAGALTPLAAGLWAASDPLTRKKAGGDASGDGDFIPVGSVAAVPADGSPRKFNVIADKTDAWTIHRNVPIGSVYVRRNDDGSLQAFNAACPHLGCFVNALPDGSFGCPCHDSEFQPGGDIRPITRTGARTVALRGLDELAVKVSEDGQTVLVKFENYQAGLAEQKRIP
jgi:menaquinol-cytochrome c reductase iron-sulfur subunit